ncbi:MAG: glutamyl-tRNA reductase [Gammaproteobacteria bacterium]|nr:glutamyl-tRNA reductase [Gammaproteobacteria bacterium]
MPLIALGINHRTAPVDIRERVAFPSERLDEALRALVELPEVQEAAILSTCNRTELYCGLEGEDNSALIGWLCSYHHLRPEDLQPYLYIYPDEAAVRHMFRVAAGLDSMVLGEPQILGQMKTAYQSAVDAGTLTAQLGKLFQHTFTVAKQIRTDTAIGASPVSVAFAAVSLARQIFGDLSKQTALLIGAGETIELAARHLADHKLGRMIVANRTVERAHALAAEFNGYAIALSEMPTHLAEADIVISSTASQLPILGKGTVERALKKRKHRPIFMVDIAVPRDIEAEVAQLDDIYLYTVDDLKEVIQENLKSRQEAATQAEEIIDVQCAHFLGWLRSLDAVSSIRDFRAQADATRDDVLDKARQLLAQGRDAEQVIQFLAHTLTNKLIHTPSANLRQAGYEGRADLIQAARELLGLPKRDT